MKIGIIGAMSVEVAKLKDMMENVKVERISKIDFYCGELCGNEVIVAVSGVGKVNSAICTQTMILKYSPSVIMNTGVAGGISKEIKIGDLVIATAVVQHDMDSSPLGDPVGFISGINMIDIPSANYLVELLKKASETIENTNVFTGIIATGDQFINSNDEIMRISKQFGAIATEMEGGSIGHVCYVNGVDFCVVRSISDGGDDSSNMDFLEFLDIAVKKSIELTINFLRLVKNYE